MKKVIVLRSEKIALYHIDGQEETKQEFSYSDIGDILKNIAKFFSKKGDRVDFIDTRSGTYKDFS